MKNPPWIFTRNFSNKTFIDNSTEENKELEVTGRDDTLLKILAQKMNFKFEYVDVMSLVEMEMFENVTQVSAVGLEMLKKRVRNFDLFNGFLSFKIQKGSGLCVWRYRCQL